MGNKTIGGIPTLAMALTLASSGCGLEEPDIPNKVEVILVDDDEAPVEQLSINELSDFFHRCIEDVIKGEKIEESAELTDYFRYRLEMWLDYVAYEYETIADLPLQNYKFSDIYETGETQQICGSAEVEVRFGSSPKAIEEVKITGCLVRQKEDGRDATFLMIIDHKDFEIPYTRVTGGCEKDPGTPDEISATFHYNFETDDRGNANNLSNCVLYDSKHRRQVIENPQHLEENGHCIDWRETILAAMPPIED